MTLLLLIGVLVLLGIRKNYFQNFYLALQGKWTV